MTERGKYAPRRPIRAQLPGEEEVVAELRRRTPGRGTRKRVAHELDVSENTIGRVLAGKVPPSLKIAQGLGFRLVKDDEHPPG